MTSTELLFKSQGLSDDEKFDLLFERYRKIEAQGIKLNKEIKSKLQELGLYYDGK